MLKPALQSADRDFTAFVDGLAAGLLELSPTFEAFVQGMPGVLPDEALAALHRLGGPKAMRLTADAMLDHAPAVLDQGPCLPLPHPLDSEFRFDGETTRILAGALLGATRDGDEILLIGVPSVAVELAASSADRKFRYLGPNNCVTAAVRAAASDGRLILGKGGGGSAAAALLDPPWYNGPMRHLLEVAAFGCRTGATVHLILPSRGTRPEIERDRETFFGFALSAGLSPTDFGGPVGYRTPLFELAALERQGIARLPNWRRGDVIGFRAGERRIDAAPWTAPGAIELTVEGIRLRLITGTKGGTEKLIPISDHEIFPSVSARAPGRAAATLWTTTNRAFLVDPVAAGQAMDVIAQLPAEVLHTRLYDRAFDEILTSPVAAIDDLIHQVWELIGRELFDARRLVGDDAWCKTAVEWRC